MRSKVAAAGITAAIFFSIGFAQAPPSPSAAPASGEWREFTGQQVAAVLLAWTALSDAVPDVPELSDMYVTYSRAEGIVIVTFVAPLRESVVDGRRVVTLGSNIYEVYIRGDSVTVVPPPPP